MAIFCQFGWDDQHLLPNIFHSVQGFPGDLARSLGKDVTLNDVLQMLDKHYGVIMTFDALSKECYSLKQGLNKNMSLGYIFCSRSRYSSQSSQEGSSQNTWERQSAIGYVRVLIPNTSKYWLIKWMVSTLLATLACS